LEELNWRTLPRSANHGEHGIDKVDSKSGKAQASPAISTKKQKAKVQKKSA
jgi:hypothetical protein